MRGAVLWAAVLAAALLPLGLAAMSPLLAWRQPIYILAGFAGIIAMALLLVQPVLIAGRLPGVQGPKGRRMHLWVGLALVAAVVVHVLGLWITSPPDVVDALLFASPTPFSAWGVVAMWAVFAGAGIAVLRRRLGLAPRVWRGVHTGLAAIVVCGTVVHVLLIQGTMEPVSKIALSGAVILATAWAIALPRLRRMAVRRR